MLRPTLTLFPLVLLASCAATPSSSKHPAPSEIEATLTAFADDLVERAELRADVRSIRLQVAPLEVREARPSRPGELPALAGSLGHDLVLALSRHFHVLDSEVAAATLPGATHALTGDLLRLDREVRVSLRLVEVSTGVIVATTEGTLLVRELIDRGALAWEPRPTADLAQAEPEREDSHQPLPVDAPEPVGVPEPEFQLVQDPALEAVAAAPSLAPPEEFEELPPVRGPSSVRLGRLRQE